MIRLPSDETWKLPSATVRGRRGGETKGDIPLLCMHGLGSDMNYYDFIWPTLTAHRHCIAYDHPGFGPTAHEPAPARIEHLSEVASEVIAAHTDGQVDVIASSMGGLVAIHLMRFYPHLVRRAVLLCPAGAGDPRPVTAKLASLLGETSSLPPAQWFYLWSTYKQHMYQTPPGGMSKAEWRQWFFRRACFVPLELQVRNFMLTAGNILVTHGLDWASGIVQPVLIILGTNDELISIESAERYENAIPDCRLVLIEGGTHGLLTSYQDQIAPHALDFLVFNQKGATAHPA